MFTVLASARRILVAGAGGGFDVYAGLPLAFALTAAGKQVYLANLSFANLDLLAAADRLGDGVAAIRPDSVGLGDYFPERTLARWLDSRGLPSTVYAFARTGVQPLRAAYRTLITHLGVDAVVLIDGGTDILLHGDEAGLGTPEEDATSLTAVAGLDDVATRVVVCVGFGIDAHHGVCHAHVLENLAALDRDGGYLGAVSIPRDSAEGTAFLDAVAHAQSVTWRHPSIVNGQIAAALRGEFGDLQFTDRTRGSRLFVNPLMAVYFTVDLNALAHRLRYRDWIESTHNRWQVSQAIEEYRQTTELRPHQNLPH